MTDDHDDGDADVDVFDSASEGQAAESDPRWVELPSSAMLNVEAADALLRWRPAVLVAIIGERNSGKTTLITEIYEQFLRGPFASSLFADSLSLLGFERKSFQSRAVSGAAQPNTPRTSAQEGLLFFHLAVSNDDTLKRTDLLISERAGELYREVRDRPDRAAELIEVVKSDFLVFIIDGERVADDLRRAEAFASVRNIVRALTDAGAVPPTAEVQVVTTKCDLLEAESASVARDALAQFEQKIAELCAGRISSISMHRTAARDPNGVVESALGLSPLLCSWLQPRPRETNEHPPAPAPADEFDRLFFRRPRNED